MAFQNYYDETHLSKAKDKYIFLPATIESGDVKVTILESDLRAYPGMFVKADGLHLRAAFAKYPKRMDYYKWRGMSYVAETEDYIAKSKGPRTYPWRVMAITEKDFQAICDAIKKEDRSGKEVAAEISRLTLALRNLYELLRARMR